MSSEASVLLGKTYDSKTGAPVYDWRDAKIDDTFAPYVVAELTKSIEEIRGHQEPAVTSLMRFECAVIESTERTSSQTGWFTVDNIAYSVTAKENDRYEISSQFMEPQEVILGNKASKQMQTEYQEKFAALQAARENLAQGEAWIKTLKSDREREEEKIKQAGIELTKPGLTREEIETAQKRIEEARGALTTIDFSMRRSERRIEEIKFDISKLETSLKQIDAELKNVIDKEAKGISEAYKGHKETVEHMQDVVIGAFDRLSGYRDGIGNPMTLEDLMTKDEYGRDPFVDAANGLTQKDREELSNNKETQVQENTHKIDEPAMGLE